MNPKNYLFNRGWLSSAYLLLLVGGAAVGALSELDPAMMIAGAALALISWELMEKMPYWQRGNGAPLFTVPKWVHLKVLISSVGLGLLLAEAGSLVHLPIPFGFVILAVMLLFFSLNRFIQLSIK